MPGGRVGVRKDYTRRGKRKRLREYRIFSRDNFRCVYCGVSPRDEDQDRVDAKPVKLEADHIVPRSRGGQDTAGNFVTACQVCNRSKFDEELDPEDEARLLEQTKRRNAKRRLGDDVVIKLGRV